MDRRIHWQILSAELAQIKSQLSSEEKERQYEKIWRRRKYWKIGLANPSIERIDGEPMTWKTDFSVFIPKRKNHLLSPQADWRSAQVRF